MSFEISTLTIDTIITLPTLNTCAKLGNDHSTTVPPEMGENINTNSYFPCPLSPFLPYPF